MPLIGDEFTGEANADETLRRSRYGDMYRLALDWTASAETNYDRVKAIEANLQEDYVYAERVPTRPIPLNGFLFDDRRGYCQQFSGTMALMLRMLGIPARVAAGFSPGSYNRDTGEFRVRDLDAHSWVEVYFTGHRLGAVRPDSDRVAGRVAVRRPGGHQRGERATGAR